jgi:hypothetical protein
MKSSQSKAIILNTQCYTYEEVEYLCVVLLENFGLNCWPRAQQDRPGVLTYQIYISGSSYEKVRELIFPYIHSSLLYKFPTERKNRGKPSIGVTVLHESGVLFKEFPNKNITMVTMQISARKLNELLENGSPYKNYLYNFS